MMTETEKRYEKASDLTVEEKMLVELRDELYHKNWIEFLNYLKTVEQKRPYNDKLVKRAKADIERIDVLRRYELNNRVNLADLLKEEQSSEN